MQSSVRRQAFAAAAALALGLALAASASAQTTYNVAFDDPGAVHAAYYAAITQHVAAAGDRWQHFMDPLGPRSLEVRIGFPAIPTGNGRSTTSSFVYNNGTHDIFEQGAMAELRTGVDPNGGTHDIEFNFGSNYLIGELWFDPNPYARTAQVPANRTDAMSVFLHEFGHALMFNGWRSGTTGALPGSYASTFDEDVMFDGSNLFHVGPQAVAQYGGPVPVTFGNYAHLGNNLPRPGSDLIPDLMNGVVFFRGTRYDISPLDLAIARDSGAPFTAVPEPGVLVLLGAAAGGAAYARWRRRDGRAEAQNPALEPAGDGLTCSGFSNGFFA